MAVNESDMEMLHAYLDGELSTAESEGLWRRLAIERDLTAELDSLRADHAVRGVVWSTLEPDDHSIARVQARLMRATRREDILSTLTHYGRIATSAAALILLGITIGWMGKNHMAGVPNAAAMNPSSSNTSTASSPLGTLLPTTASRKVNVNLYDSSGKLISVQQFDSLEEANRFVHDYRASQSALPVGGESTAPSVDKF